MRLSVRTFFLSLVAVVFFAVSAGAVYYPVGDLDEGRDVDFDDLRLFAQNWLNPSCVEPGCEADLNGKDGVNGVDYALLTGNWGGIAVITEFMASNQSDEPLEDGELLDEDGDSSDWIEIFNPTDTTVNLDGWYLTHDVEELTEWEFPAVALGPGEFMIVFASEKDRRDPDADKPLHTNFNLSKGGDYLAIVRSDGQTIVHEYSPEYPGQLSDISYGLAQYAQMLVTSGANASYQVPTSGDSGADWTASDFDASEWKTGPTGLGFGNVLPGFSVTYYKSNVSVGSLNTAESVITNSFYQSSTATETASVIDYLNTGETGHFPYNNPFPSTIPGFNVDNFVVLATGRVLIPASGNWTFGVSSDDGFGLELSRGSEEFSSSFPTGRSAGDTLATFDLTESGSYDLRLVYFEGGGGSEVELFAAQGSHSGFDDDFQLVGDTSNGELAVSNFGGEAETDVQDLMENTNCSLWTRIEFSAEEVEFFTSMTLRVRYEDGFVAYLNGEEIARDNFTGAAAWNSAADVDRVDEESMEFSSIDVSSHLGALREGRNILAIQAMNDDAGDDEFLILPELVAAGEASVSQYFSTATPGEYNASGSLDVVSDTKFSRNRGFYDEAFSVTITTETEGATIHYTTDGSTPSEAHGTEYVGPIDIDTTTCLRAMAFKVYWMPTDVDTHTYIFLDDVVHQPGDPEGFPSSWNGYAADYEMDPEIVEDPQYRDLMRESLLSLPTISIVTDVDYLFASDGIYSNPESEGVAWERPASAEWINADGTTAFQVNCGLRIYGGWFRQMSATRKKTFRFLFKRDYGPTKLRYPVFGEDAADEFDTFILRAGANDDIQYIVDEFMRRTQLALGRPSPHGNFAHLYLNGLYWGLYNPVERPEQSFAATYFGGDKENWEALNSSTGIAGSSTTTWNAMLNIIRGGMTSNEAYQKIQGNNVDGTNNPGYDDLLDVENYIDYMYCNFWGGTTDWPSHNWYGACLLPPNSTGFKFFNWDSERAITITTTINGNSTGVSAGAGEPYAALRQNAEFCTVFGDYVHKHLFNDGVTTAAPSYARYAELADEIELAMISESARWGDQKTSTPRRLEDWQAGRDYILDTYMPQRPDIALDQLRGAGLYPYLSAPAFNVNGDYQHGGEIGGTEKISMFIPDDVEYIDVELVSEGAAVYVHVPTDDSLGLSWTSSSYTPDSSWEYSLAGTGVGYENGSGYEAWINTDVGAEMYGLETSVFILIEFTLDGGEDFDRLELQMVYDDAFIAYLNGVEVDRTDNITNATPGSATANWLEADGSYDKFDITDFKDELVGGRNVLAIHGINASTGSSDMLILPKLMGGTIDVTPISKLILYTTDGSDPRQLYGARNPDAIEYSASFTLGASRNVKARTLDEGEWSALNEATFGVGPVVEDLRITEIMFHPQDTGDANDPNEEYIELKNTGGESINLNLVKFVNGIDFTFGDIELGGGGLAVIVRDREAFEAEYPGFSGVIAGEYSGSLNNGGERIELEDAIGQSIHNFSFSDDWRPITDGEGFSLTIIDAGNSDPNSWDEKDSWRASAYAGGSPGEDDSGILPDPGAIAINEVMAHSHDTAPDWIELYNTTGAEIEIGGWYLSDSSADLKKYRIADGERIGAYSYMLFYEDANFGEFSSDPGMIRGFAFSENGDATYLSSAEGGVLLGYREYEDFWASPTGVSFGRYYKASTGNYNFVMLDSNTPGWGNADPKVGPVVINEIMYNPQDDMQEEEYIELHNFGSTDVTLYDSDEDVAWKFTGGVDYTFPDGPGLTIGAGGYVVIAKDVTAYLAKYGAPPFGVSLLGPYIGSLSNGGEKLELSMPGDVDEFGVRYYIRADRVNYSDGSHHGDAPGGVDLWPVGADGDGKSLTRTVAGDYGNDPDNWTAEEPSPGE